MLNARSLFFAALAGGFLSACATAPSYAPALEANGSGYSHVQVEANRFFVTYRARSGAEAQLIEDMALLRAAELTLEQGADWFVVDRRTTDESNARSSGPSVGVSVGGATFGGRSSSGVGVGISIPVGGGGAQARVATLEIRTGSGDKPDVGNAYDARAVAASLRPRLAVQ
jgi:hypothetical protein